MGGEAVKVRVQKVISNEIRDGSHVWQTLACGHIILLWGAIGYGRLPQKRQCGGCLCGAPTGDWNPQAPDRPPEQVIETGADLAPLCRQWKPAGSGSLETAFGNFWSGPIDRVCTYGRGRSAQLWCYRGRFAFNAKYVGAQVTINSIADARRIGKELADALGVPLEYRNPRDNRKAKLRVVGR